MRLSLDQWDLRIGTRCNFLAVSSEDALLFAVGKNETLMVEAVMVLRHCVEKPHLGNDRATR
jgi:hypothetical protein